MFPGQKYLSALLLAYNQITSFQVGSICELRSLLKLDLSGNRLTSLPIGTFGYSFQESAAVGYRSWYTPLDMTGDTSGINLVTIPQVPLYCPCRPTITHATGQLTLFSCGPFRPGDFGGKPFDVLELVCFFTASQSGRDVCEPARRFFEREKPRALGELTHSDYILSSVLLCHFSRLAEESTLFLDTCCDLEWLIINGEGQFFYNPGMIQCNLSNTPAYEVIIRAQNSQGIWITPLSFLFVPYVIA